MRSPAHATTRSTRSTSSTQLYAIMPLIVVCGVPSSGKSTRAKEVEEWLKTEQKSVHIVSEDTLLIDKQKAYSSMPLYSLLSTLYSLLSALCSPVSCSTWFNTSIPSSPLSSPSSSLYLFYSLLPCSITARKEHTSIPEGLSGEVPNKRCCSHL